MTKFRGFPRKLPEFFSELEKNNSKAWFDSHKEAYETHVKLPSQEFVAAMGEHLKEISPGINAIPKVNKSLFRLNRDTRFSHDKSPYKTNLGILFWEGPCKRMESSGFYFHMEKDLIKIGCGMYIFPKNLLDRFRHAVVDKTGCRELKAAVETVSAKGYRISTRHYRRIPRGFTPSSDFEKEFLLYNGLSAMIEMPIPGYIHTDQAVDFVFRHFRLMLPVHEWVVKHLQN